MYNKNIYLLINCIHINNIHTATGHQIHINVRNVHYTTRYIKHMNTICVNDMSLVVKQFFKTLKTLDSEEPSQIELIAISFNLIAPN